ETRLRADARSPGDPRRYQRRAHALSDDITQLRAEWRLRPSLGPDGQPAVRHRIDSRTARAHPRFVAIRASRERDGGLIAARHAAAANMGARPQLRAPRSYRKILPSTLIMSSQSANASSLARSPSPGWNLLDQPPLYIRHCEQSTSGVQHLGR